MEERVNPDNSLRQIGDFREARLRECEHLHASGDTGKDAGQAVLDDGAMLRRNAVVPRSMQEQLRVRLPCANLVSAEDVVLKKMQQARGAKGQLHLRARSV